MPALPAFVRNWAVMLLAPNRQPYPWRWHLMGGTVWLAVVGRDGTRYGVILEQADAVPILPRAVEAALSAALETGSAEGLSPPFLDAFKSSFFRGAGSIVRPFLDRLAATDCSTLIRLPLAVGTATAPRRLTLEDSFGLPDRPIPEGT